jgi:2-methylcitrate dehydratase PrpD
MTTNQPILASVLADFIAGACPSDLPADVRREAERTFLNFLGCAIGGARTNIVDKAIAGLSAFFGPANTTLIARGRSADACHAALINGLSSSVHAYDDTFADTILHPGGPVGAAALALAEQAPVSGADFITACALGLEIECRLSLAISAPPARGNVAWSQTGLVGGVGAAVAAGKLLRLDRGQLINTIGLAAGMAHGFRALHGSMATPMLAGQGAEAGVRAALLAQQGFTATPHTLDGKLGFLNVFAAEPNAFAVSEALGRDYRLLRNTYKPYPCGIVIHAIIDGCLDVRAERPLSALDIDRVSILAPPETVTLTDRRHPDTDLDGQLSLYHWAAVALLQGAAGHLQGTVECLRDATIAALRERIEARADRSLAYDQAVVTVHLRDGTSITKRAEHCSGSPARPMTDAQLAEKFSAQARDVLGPTRSLEALVFCQQLGKQPDVATLARLVA